MKVVFDETIDDIVKNIALDAFYTFNDIISEKPNKKQEFYDKKMSKVCSKRKYKKYKKLYYKNNTGGGLLPLVAVGLGLGLLHSIFKKSVLGK